ncbi:MAG: alanine racemase [Oscillospiraceae bacterium]
MIPQRIYAEINLDRICENIKNVMQKIGNSTKVMAVVKSDAYGHGAVMVSKALAEIGVSYFAVATSAEAIELRENGIDKPILILGYVFSQDFKEMISQNISLTVFEYESAMLISKKAKELGKIATIHIKIDTGMGRIGFLPTDESIEEIEKISQLENLKIEGIFTHFANADEKDKTSCNGQIKQFLDFIKKLESENIKFELKHMCNSAAVIDFDDGFLDIVRSGIMTYGLYPSDEVDRSKLLLKPAMQIKSHIAFVKSVPKDFSVSYGSTFITDKKMKIATIPVGYGDGYSRGLSNKGKVIIKGEFANIIGRVCMDQFMVDVTNIKDVKQGDEAIIMGSDGKKTITAEEISSQYDSFNYEFCCDINKRVPRIYIKNGTIIDN